MIKTFFRKITCLWKFWLFKCLKADTNEMVKGWTNECIPVYMDGYASQLFCTMC